MDESTMIDSIAHEKLEWHVGLHPNSLVLVCIVLYHTSLYFFAFLLRSSGVTPATHHIQL